LNLKIDLEFLVFPRLLIGYLFLKIWILNLTITTWDFSVTSYPKPHEEKSKFVNKNLGGDLGFALDAIVSSLKLDFGLTVSDVSVAGDKNMVYPPHHPP
jgi:hypothetical protein